MWRKPLPLFAGAQADIVQTITEDTYVGDLYVFVGSPTNVVDVEITVDSADAGEIIIPNTFALGSTFEFICTNGGRILGVGGDGGNGGADFGSTGEAGDHGNNGGHAIVNQGTYPVSLNVDDGFIYGGGGGGGGGSYDQVLATTGDPGGGGGGGQGFNGGDGGQAGNPDGLPLSSDGTPGSINAPGVGGLGGGVGEQADGGNGGAWGEGGRTGRSSQLVGGGVFGGFLYYGGLGGDAGRAFSGGGVTLTGAETEATLRSQDRIKGELGSPYLNLPNFQTFWAFKLGIPYDTTFGITFKSNGRYIEVDSQSAPIESSQYYLNSTGTGADYEVRIRGLTGDTSGEYDNKASPNGTWIAISSARSWTEFATFQSSRAALFELRRSDMVGTTSTSDEVMASFYVRNIFEAEP